MSAKGNQCNPYPPVGQCIYCGADGGVTRLGKEHIIPVALGGNFVLPRASCSSCGAITGYIEGACTHDQMFYATRLFEGLIRRRKKLPRQMPPLVLNYGTHKERRIVPLKANPRTFMTYRFGPPGMLAGHAPSNKWDVIGVVGRSYPPNQTFGARIITQELRLPEAEVFGRMLAKIAHAYAVAELGLNGFRPYLRATILQPQSFTPYYVGGSMTIQPIINTLWHEIGISFREWSGKKLVVIRIRLFCFLPSPNYFVIAGETDQEFRTRITRERHRRTSFTQSR